MLLLLLLAGRSRPDVRVHPEAAFAFADVVAVAAALAAALAVIDAVLAHEGSTGVRDVLGRGAGALQVLPCLALVALDVALQKGKYVDNSKTNLNRRSGRRQPGHVEKKATRVNYTAELASSLTSEGR